MTSMTNKVIEEQENSMSKEALDVFVQAYLKAEEWLIFSDDEKAKELREALKEKDFIKT